MIAQIVGWSILALAVGAIGWVIVKELWAEREVRRAMLRDIRRRGIVVKIGSRDRKP